jgi:hypothetical protein
MTKRFLNAILNCEFEYKCPLNWDELDSTNSSNIKFCKTCDKAVKLCVEQSEIDFASETGLCIAYPLYTPEMEKKIKDYDAGICENPFSEIEKPMGLPKRTL